MSLTKVSFAMINGAPVNVLDYGAKGDGVTDDTAAVQAAITAGSVVFPPGSYALTGNISVPGNRKILISKGATVTNTGGRFTSENVTNVEWQIDGWLKSVAMATAPKKPLWYSSIFDERGFIEFAQDYVPGSAAYGFWVHGTGKVSGDWVGTPNVSDLAFQTNRKGIACWNAANVLVEGVEVYGFDGEAVYAYFFDAASKNIVFENNYVHDTRFNALNFNAATNGGGCVIRNNMVRNAYQVEISAGSCIGNDIANTIGPGIYTGLGIGYGPMLIDSNIIAGAGLHSIAVSYASGSPVTDVAIANNISINPAAYGVYVDQVRNLTVSGNTFIGTGQSAGSYDIGVNNTQRAQVLGNTIYQPGPSAQPGRVFIDPANCFDASLCPYTNVYLPSTAVASPKTNNGAVSIPSASTLLLPPIGCVFFVSGNTNITSIAPLVVNSNHNGREITLIFESILTVVDGSNLKIAGNFVTKGTDTITLVGDGTNWYEKCRSVN